ncbi:MAG: cyclase [Gammaproteobacteria bacterium]|nr:cyclase [Gammaproteobacteria bacterium]NNM13363.1 cyclase [Gammaproteobacteria bacterium]
MAFYYVDHIVHDFDAWKKVYDQYDALRAAHGITDHQILQSVDNPNRVIVYGEGEVKMIHKFILSPEAQAAMREAGVAGPPTVFIGEDKS